MSANLDAGGNFPLEPKVKWQAVWGYVSSVIILGLIAILQNGPFLLAVIPDPLEVFVLPLIPGLIGLLVGYNTRHQWRGSGDRDY